jgi:adenylosuccinate lyase
MIPRYSRAAMVRIWSEENKFASWLKVELAALEALADEGFVPAEVPQKARALAKIDAARILEIEERTHHDVAAFVDQVASTLGEYGQYFHFGLTSSDVLDTALALR